MERTSEGTVLREPTVLVLLITSSSDHRRTGEVGWPFPGTCTTALLLWNLLMHWRGCAMSRLEPQTRAHPGWRRFLLGFSIALQ